MANQDKERTIRSLMIFILSDLGFATLAGVIKPLCLSKSGGRNQHCFDVRRRILAASAS